MWCEQPNNPEVRTKCGFNVEALSNANNEELQPLTDAMEGRWKIADKEGLSFSVKSFIALCKGISYENGNISFTWEDGEIREINFSADTKDVKYSIDGFNLIIETTDHDGDAWKLKLVSKNSGQTFSVKKEKVAEVKANKEITLLNSVGPDFFHLEKFADRFDTLYDNFDNLRYDERVVLEAQLEKYIKRETRKNISINTLTTGYDENGKEAFIVNDRFKITRGTN